MKAEEGFKVITNFLKAPRSPKRIFLDEHAEEISKAATDLLKKDLSLNGCRAGAHSRAWTELWEVADKAVYEEKARTLITADDVFV